MKVKPSILFAISAILFAEALIFFKYYRYGTGIHIITLLGLSLTAYRFRETGISNALQVLALLPLFRILNNTMPTFFIQTLYVFPFVYGPMLLSMYFVGKNQKFTRYELGLSIEKIYIYLPASLILGIVLGKIEYFIIAVESLIPGPGLENILVFALIMIVFTGLTEEMLFRSFVQTRLEQTIGSNGGLLAASFLFGAMHSGYGSIYEMIFTFLAGFILGYLFQKTRNLPFIALTHGFINVFLFGLIPMGLI